MDEQNEAVMTAGGVELNDFNTTSRSLEYYFSDDEKLGMSKQLSAEVQNKRKLEDQKKAVMSQYSSQINEKTEAINMLSDKLAAGYEFRNIQCRIDWHTPGKNKKTIERLDTGERWIENMTEFDHNLFTQWQEKLQEEADAESEAEATEVLTDESDEAKEEMEPAATDKDAY